MQLNSLYTTHDMRLSNILQQYILLLSPTVCELQKLLDTCERELDATDLFINV